MTDPSVAKQAIGVLDNLKSTPVLLALILLNCAFIASAAYYLIHTEESRASERGRLIDALDSCVKNTVPIDYLKDKKE